VTAAEADLLERIRMRLAEQSADPSPAQVADALRSEGRLIGDVAVLDMVDALRSDTVGAGVLEPLLRLEGVTDVVVNGARDVYVDTGRGLDAADVRFADDAAVRRLAQRLAGAAGRRLDDASPYVDVRLGDGTRFHAVLSPVASPGTCLSLRVPARRSLTLADLISSATATDEGAALLLEVMRARLAFVISGGTGSGKTTLLAALLSYADPSDRLVIVEDASELRPRHPHVVSLEARPPNVEGAGAITLRELVRQALRMRPDRLIVGEVRGAEVVDMLAAMNTGHQGGCGTIHANAANDVPARFEALGTAAGLPRDAVHAQLAAAVQVVIHLRRGSDGVRRLVQIAVVRRRADGFVDVIPAVAFPPGRAPVTSEGASILDGWLTEAAS
jgi:pilus assembly protein CpaF